MVEVYGRWLAAEASRSVLRREVNRQSAPQLGLASVVVVGDGLEIILARVRGLLSRKGYKINRLNPVEIIRYIAIQASRTPAAHERGYAMV